MEEDIEEKIIAICQTWIEAAVKKEDSEKVKHIFAVMDMISGTKLQKYIDEANEFLKSIKQTDQVKEIIDYVKNREAPDRGLPLF